jgi:hypothetical protein
MIAITIHLTHKMVDENIGVVSVALTPDVKEKGQCKSANLETAIWRLGWAARIDISYNAEQIEPITP